MEACSVESLSDIIRQRKVPGILLFASDQTVIYMNDEALNIIADLKRKKRSCREIDHDIPVEIYAFYRRVKNDIKNCPACEVLNSGSGRSYVIRAFPIGSGEDANTPTQILCLLEGAAEQHAIDFEKAASDFKLSKREQGVLRLLCQGLSNKGISEALFISEYTVKGHVKKIMMKMTASSRSKVISLLNK